MDNSPLFKITKHAYETVPFYRKLAEQMQVDVSDLISKSAFSDIPLVDKQMVQKNSQLMLSEQYLTYPNNSRLMIRRTSGSTGHYLKIYWDYRDNTKSLMGLWYDRKKFYDIYPNNKYCYFYTTDYRANKLIDEPEIRISPDKRSIGFSKNELTEKKLFNICNKIAEFDPYYMLLQPSMAILLMECMEKNNLQKFKALRYIELTGEMVIDSLRDKLEKFFNCLICNQYGCNEANSIASEHGDRNLYVQSSNVHVEIIKDGKCMPDGEYGDIYITSLTNFAMPFIRYKIGDQGRLLHKDNEKILELAKGRATQFVMDKDGNKLPSYIFLRPIEHINEELGIVINQFQIVQYGIDNFQAYFSIVPAYTGWKETIEKLFLANIKQSTIRNANWKFEYRDNIFPDTVTGKLSYFYNKIDGGNYEE